MARAVWNAADLLGRHRARARVRGSCCGTAGCRSGLRMIARTSVYGLSGWARIHWRQPSKPLSPAVAAGPLGRVGDRLDRRARLDEVRELRAHRVARAGRPERVEERRGRDADDLALQRVGASAPAVQSLGRCPLATSSSGSAGASIAVAFSSSARSGSDAADDARVVLDVGQRHHAVGALHAVGAAQRRRGEPRSTGPTASRRSACRARRRRSSTRPPRPSRRWSRSSDFDGSNAFHTWPRRARAEVPVVGELGQVGLAHDDRAGLAQLGHEPGVLGRAGSRRRRGCRRWSACPWCRRCPWPGSGCRAAAACRRRRARRRRPWPAPSRRARPSITECRPSGPLSYAAIRSR